MAEANMENLYSIGEAADICNVSRKTLRFYEELGLLIPDYICMQNNYRYYSEDTVMAIPILKYYKQMGFHLHEMLGVTNTRDYFFHQHNFFSKIDSLNKELRHIQDCYEAVSDWISLLDEGTAVTQNDVCNISLKYIEREQYHYLEQDFCYDYKKSIINIEWTNYLETTDSKVTGPVILEFSDYRTKNEGKIKKATVIQKPIQNSQSSLPKKDFGGQMFLCTYHVGDHCTIAEKYLILEKWACEHGYQIGPNCYERYVIDFWSTQDVHKFVTEIMISATKIK